MRGVVVLSGCRGGERRAASKASNGMQKSRSTGAVCGGTRRSNIESWPLRLSLCPAIGTTVLVGREGKIARSFAFALCELLAMPLLVQMDQTPRRTTSRICL